MKKYIIVLFLIIFPFSVLASDVSLDNNLPIIKVTKPTSGKKIAEGSDFVIKWKVPEVYFDEYMIVLKNKLVPGLGTSGQIFPKGEKSFTYSGNSLTNKNTEFWLANSNVSLSKLRKNFYFEITARKSGQDVAIGNSKTFSIVENKIKDKSGVTKEDHFISGNLFSKVKVITYSDLECPFCYRFDKTIRTLSKDYGNDVAFVFRQYPLTQIHSNAYLAANATECMANLYKDDTGLYPDLMFSKYLEKIFDAKNNGEILDFDTLINLANSLGASESKMTSCLTSNTYYKKIDRDMKFIDKKTLSNQFGTPYTEIISGSKKTVVIGAVPINEIKSKIDAYLK